LPSVEERPEEPGSPAIEKVSGSSPGGDKTAYLGAWGYQVSATWGPGHVKGKAEVYELGSCWVDEIL